MKVLIGRPHWHLEQFKKLDNMLLDDILILYDMLPSILDEMQVEYKVLHMQNHQIIKENNSIFLAWHNHGTSENTWFIKTSYLQDYFYFDKYGHSGWSELAKKYEYDVDVNSMRNEIQIFCDDYILSNRSRCAQPKEAFVPAEPYVLVLQQRQDDAVAQFAYIDNQTLLDRVTELYKGTSYRVVTKAHPLAKHALHNIDAFEATGSIHKIIAGATAVYTVNSGGGFESLLHGKRVFTTGHCDYHWATDVIKTDADLQASVRLAMQPANKDKIIKFLHYTLNKHFINIHDIDTIKHKIQRALDEYK